MTSKFRIPRNLLLKLISYASELRWTEKKQESKRNFNALLLFDVYGQLLESQFKYDDDYGEEICTALASNVYDMLMKKWHHVDLKKLPLSPANDALWQFLPAFAMDGSENHPFVLARTGHMARAAMGYLKIEDGSIDNYLFEQPLGNKSTRDEYEPENGLVEVVEIGLNRLSTGNPGHFHRKVVILYEEMVNQWRYSFDPPTDEIVLAVVPFFNHPVDEGDIDDEMLTIFAQRRVELTACYEPFWNGENEDFEDWEAENEDLSDLVNEMD